jgi:hypothetical protein
LYMPRQAAHPFTRFFPDLKLWGTPHCGGVNILES